VDLTAANKVKAAGTASATGAAETSFSNAEVLDMDDVNTVFITSASAVRRLVSAAASALTCSIGLLQADSISHSQMYSTCRPLTKLQEQKIKKVKGVASVQFMGASYTCGEIVLSFPTYLLNHRELIPICYLLLFTTLAL